MLNEFGRVLEKLGLDANTLSRDLFEAFDAEGVGSLEFRELFIGMAFLLPCSREVPPP